MKITLDLALLVAEGKLTAAEAERLKTYAAADTGQLAINILLGLGAAAVAAGVGILIPSLETLIGLGAVLFVAGFAMRMARIEQWSIFAQIIMVIGALALGGGLFALFGEQLWVRVALTLGLAVAGGVAASGLLISLAVLAFGATITMDADLWTPAHYLAAAIGALSLLTLALYLVSLRLPPAYERLAIVAMRTAILLVNAAFFIGSVFGDERLGWSSLSFAIAWVLALLAFGAWAVFANRRWVVNVVAVFGAVHFFTQWFMALGAQPLSILGGGLLLIGFGLALAQFNRLYRQRKAVA